MSNLALNGMILSLIFVVIGAGLIYDDGSHGAYAALNNPFKLADNDDSRYYDVVKINQNTGLTSLVPTSGVQSFWDVDTSVTNDIMSLAPVFDSNSNATFVDLDQRTTRTEMPALVIDFEGRTLADIRTSLNGPNSGITGTNFIEYDIRSLNSSLSEGVINGTHVYLLIKDDGTNLSFDDVTNNDSAVNVISLTNSTDLQGQFNLDSSSPTGAVIAKIFDTVSFDDADSVGLMFFLDTTDSMPNLGTDTRTITAQFVATKSTNIWKQIDKQLASDGVVDDQFGFSTSIHGDTVVVGANGVNSFEGAAYIFERNQGGTNNWGLAKKLTTPGGGSFGAKVAIHGDTVVVAAPFDDDKATDAGTAYIFERNQGGTNNWGQVKKITASDGAAEDDFGFSVSIYGDTVIVGADLDDDNGSDAGTAYIFERNQGGTNNWGQVKKITASDGAAVDQFGSSTAIHENTVVIGAWGDDSFTGSAYIFERNQGGTNNWGQVKKITASDRESNDIFSGDLGAAIHGNTVLIGAYGDDSFTGSAYIFERNQGGTDNWGQVKKITASDRESNDHFGFSVGMSGDTVVIGAQGVNSFTGSAYIFERNQGGTDNWGLVEKVTASDGATGDQFGYSVSINGNTFVAGAWADDDNGSNSGSSYIFSDGSCQPPSIGDWTVTSSCTMSSSAAAAGNVIVQNGATLTVSNGVTLEIDFTNHNLTIGSGGNVIIESGGAIQ